ncbi:MULTISPECIES: hypothetical protein [unclassified Sphingopyxis]|jgi:hypothetical protein|uniref:hypothetical protein n=1 Tax=unclassified Sphingopyxis TaxID=2614943 RepID=UPI000DC63CB7|nr:MULTISPECIES: hypothetical protein [unclassified Sphingopyxis]BBB07424.1 hypothetical protein SPYCW_0440 [Sphingopyxis sp. EG6]
MERTLLQRIDAFLKESAMPPTVFGRAAVRDPRLVSDLREGREPGRQLICRVEHFMNIWRAERHAGRVAPQGDRRTRGYRRVAKGAEA